MSSVRSTDLRPALAALVLCAALGGCSEYYLDHRDTLSLSAGDAIASDKVTQMVDPWPRYAANRNLLFNGERMQAAAERYRNGKVTPPANATTSSAAYQAPQINLTTGGGK